VVDRRLIVTVIGLITLSIALFSGKIRGPFRRATSDRAGLVMLHRAQRVKLRVVEVAMRLDHPPGHGGLAPD